MSCFYARYCRIVLKCILTLWQKNLPCLSEDQMIRDHYILLSQPKKPWFISSVVIRQRLNGSDIQLTLIFSTRNQFDICLLISLCLRHNQRMLIRIRLELIELWLVGTYTIKTPRQSLISSSLLSLDVTSIFICHVFDAAINDKTDNSETAPWEFHVVSRMPMTTQSCHNLMPQ